eukprot:gb/GFBE01046851.1/.p1 GENE.gb/GFBE01046851.1/~~gb/GFBE01046851.1/.p1  ORF type:complete len:325 (+),score=44.03 gb/GFBE01046851.1/:1-975(+)
MSSSMARDSSPSTPTRRRPLLRMESTEKLVDTKGVSRGGAMSAELLLASAASQPEVRASEPEPIVSVAADRIWARCAGDEKYWAQIRYAHSLLANSIGTELSMNEAVSRGEAVFEPLFRDAIDGQEADRLNAMTMLAVLRELVTRCDGEVAAARREALEALAPSLPAVVGKRPHPDDDEETYDEEHERESNDELLSDSAAVAALSLATPPPSSPPPSRRPSNPGSPVVARGCASVASTPPCTPQRPRRASAGFLSPDGFTPEAVARRASVSLTSSPASVKGEDFGAYARKRMRPVDRTSTPSFAPTSLPPPVGKAPVPSFPGQP